MAPLLTLNDMKNEPHHVLGYVVPLYVCVCVCEEKWVWDGCATLGGMR